MLFHTDLDKPFLYGPRFVHGGIVMLIQEMGFPNCCHKVGSSEPSRMSLYAVALRFPFTGTKGPSPNHETSPRPLFLLHQTLQLALCIEAGSVLLASAKPRFVRWTAPILIDGAVVEQVESFKFLCIHITNKLSWSEHTKTVVPVPLVYSLATFILRLLLIMHCSKK